MVTGTLTAFTAGLGVNSTQQSYTVSGISLTEPIVITPPADFLISTTNGSGYASTPISLTPTAGVVNATPIYVVFNRATAGVSSGNITHTSTGATSQNVAVSGTAYAPTINATSSMTAFSSMINVPSAQQNYTVAGGYLTGDITLTAPAGYQISITSGSGFGSSLVLPQAGGSVATTTIYVRMLSAAPGTIAGNIVHTSPGAATQNVAVTGTASLCGSISFQQGTNSYTGAKDTWLSLYYPTYNYGGATTVLVDGIEPNTTGDDAVILLYWDISSIPTGSTVTSASIDVYVTNTSTLSFPMYDMLQSWTEGTNNGSAGTGASWNFYGAGTGSWPGGSPISASSRNSTDTCYFHRNN